MRTRSFKTPLRRGEAIFGWIYALLYIFLLPEACRFIVKYILPLIGLSLTAIQVDIAFYTANTLIIGLVLFRFLKRSFYDLCDNLLNTCAGVILGYAVNFVLSYVLTLALSFLLKDLVNPNDATVNVQAKLNANKIFAIAVFLAPIVEETLFRGVIFGSIRKKHRLLAYVVSVFLFAVYHLWSYFLFEFDWKLFLYLLQYIPGGVALAYSYEKGRNLWSPIFLHAILNFISISVKIAI